MQKNGGRPRIKPRDWLQHVSRLAAAVSAGAGAPVVPRLLTESDRFELPVPHLSCRRLCAVENPVLKRAAGKGNCCTL